MKGYGPTGRISPLMRCKHCDGNGKVWDEWWTDNGHWAHCQSCAGTGLDREKWNAMQKTL